jgi:hypothetical protein
MHTVQGKCLSEGIIPNQAKIIFAEEDQIEI